MIEPFGREAAANIAANRQQWDKDYIWPEDGDEWRGQAELCGVPYSVWKRSLVEHLIAPNVSSESLVVEIGPGHGRWTEFLADRAARVVAVDISPACLAYCRERFSSATNVEFVLTSGNTLPEELTGAVDFLWSYDAFVHMAPQVVRAYLSQVGIVLQPAGKAIIHHANIENVKDYDQTGSPGWRSAVTADAIQKFAREASLIIEAQFQFWDVNAKIGVPRYNDCITVLRRPNLPYRSVH